MRQSSHFYISCYIRGPTTVAFIDYSRGTTFATPYFRTNNMEFRQHYLPSEAIQENGHHRIGAVSSYNWHINQEITLIMGGDAEWTEGGLTQTQEKSMKLLR